jgi:hypothetical protein
LLAPNGTRPKTKKVLPPLEPIMEPHMHMPGFINEGPGFNPFAPSSSKKEEISYDWVRFSHVSLKCLPNLRWISFFLSRLNH